MKTSGASAHVGEGSARAFRKKRMPGVVPDASTEVVGECASGSGVLVFSIAVFLVSLCVVMGLSSLLFGEVGLVAIVCSFAVAMLATMSAHIAQQWERVVVLRLGKFNRVSGPGLYWTIPIIEQNAMRVDTRIRSTTFGAEETLTSDLVPINVNAVLFWMVWDAKAACTEVGDFSRAVELAAPTALRDAIGRASAAEVAIRREQLDRELKSTLEEKVALWGITILSVEVRDILLPEELQDVMSLEAQAEQRNNEIDRYACKTYRLNFGDEYLIEGDIQKLDTKDIPKFDILTAGFPCQAFSSVGLLEGFNDPRGNLFFETARVINKIKPRVVFLENVANLVKHDEGRTFDVILKTLEDLGYYTVYKVMNAKEYGNIPQQRNRIYIVAFKYKKNVEKFKFPDMLPLTQTAFDLFDKKKQEEKYYMDGHRMWNRMMEYMDDRKRVYRFTDWGLSRGMEGICPTLLAAMGSRFERIPFFYDDFSVRLMTPRECARLQGFPESFILPKENEKQVYKQIGNSVCVPVVSRIAENIVKALN